MKINYEIIKKNLETYEKAKSILPVIGEYENGLISGNLLTNLGLNKFVDFYDSMKQIRSLGFDPIMEDITWRKLKPLISSNTKLERFQKFISNRTQNQFIEILKNPVVFDRFLNGRWITKPRTGRGRRMNRNGRRSGERIDGLKFCIAPILNYIIKNDIEIYNGTPDISTISFQNELSSVTKWYTYEVLNFDNVPIREIEVTKKLLGNLEGILDESGVDFRKLNLDFITTSISDKLRKAMIVPIGTIIKCLNDFKNDYNQQVLTKDRSYEVLSCYIQNGFVRVRLTNDLRSSDYYNYTLFEDMSIHRNELLNALFGELGI